MYHDELHFFEFYFVPAIGQRKNSVFILSFVDDLRAVFKIIDLDNVVNTVFANKEVDSKSDDFVEIIIERNSMMISVEKASVENDNATVIAA